ncbi:hypothetical protein MUP77_08890, partial [Candidatus Bathyarchaeota archaeon]|nr:hypothetical protein [Candidatus Bathyarchaeota archaeon]
NSIKIPKDSSHADAFRNWTICCKRTKRKTVIREPMPNLHYGNRSFLLYIPVSWLKVNQRSCT